MSRRLTNMLLMHLSPPKNGIIELSYIEDLKRYIDEKIPYFIGYYQHDSHEFFENFLDCLDR